MHYTSCLNPKKINNPYTHEEMYVPCRDCVACKNKVAHNWVVRLEQERSCWKYCFFFTLTYREDTIPTLRKRLSILSPTDSLPEDYRIELYDEKYDVIKTMLPQDLYDWTDKDYRFYNETERFFYCNTKLIQNFIKLFRYYANEEDEEASLRYFIASELGETTVRLHHHGLIYTNSNKVCEKFGEILRKTWKHGYISFELVESSAPSYVAAYLNANTHLPAIYRVRGLCTKTWMSRRPPIGTLVVKSAQIERLFNTASPVLNLYERKKNKFFSVPLWRCLKDRLFPKLPLFCKLPHSLRVTLYGLYENKNFFSYDEFFWFVKGEIDRNTDIGLYFLSIKRPADIAQIDRYTSWRFVYNVSKRVFYQRSIFSASLNYYVEQIDKYYANEDYLKLSNQYEFLEKQSALDELPYLLNIDKLFFDNVLLSDFESLDTNTKILLDSYGVDKYNFYFADYYDLKNTNDFRSFKFTQEKIAKDNCKTKRKNDYLEHNRMKFKNIINYYGTT